MTTVELPLQYTRSVSLSIKRAVDVVLSLTLLSVASPWMALMALLIRMDSPGPALYRQWRLGLGDRPFRMLKFRSMFAGADEELHAALEAQPAKKPQWEQYQKISDDPRMTRLGKFLRRWSLDELPQLWNVLRGEMSLVGPRPILPCQRELYKGRYNLYVLVKPGMTGLWQVSGRNQLSFAERVEHDARYIQSWSLWLDGVILFRTLWVILRADGI